MNIENQSLLHFSNPTGFFEFVSYIDIYNGWRIDSGLLNDRGKKIEGKWYTNELRNLFREKNFFRRNVSLAEIVSWLDTLSLIKRLLDSLRLIITEEEFNQIEVVIDNLKI